MRKPGDLTAPFFHLSTGLSQDTNVKPYLPKTVAGIRIPDSAMAISASALCRAASPEFLFNHCIRVYVFAALLFAKTGVKFDRETAFVAAMLHDLGLVEGYSTPDQRFEVDSADHARRFLAEFKLSPERIENVWDAIAFHTSGLLATRKAPEIAIVALGAGIDVSGRRLDEFCASDVEQVLEAAPREGFKIQFFDLLKDYVRRKPAASLFSWTDQLSRVTNADLELPEILGVITAAAFEE